MRIIVHRNVVAYGIANSKILGIVHLNVGQAVLVRQLH